MSGVFANLGASDPVAQIELESVLEDSVASGVRLILRGVSMTIW